MASAELSAESGAWELDGVDLLESPRLTYTAEAAGSGGVRVHGALTVRLALTCRRCLEPLESRAEIELDFRFDPSVRPWDEEDGVYGLDPETAVLDLSSALREELLLALPEYPECPDGCESPCPTCGESRTECECATGEPDPRWRVLRQLVPDRRPGSPEGDDETDGQ